MSSPIPIPSSSSGLYVPVHRRNRSTASSYTSSASSRTSSPSPSLIAFAHAPSYVYTPADLLSLAHSPLAQRSMVDMDARLRVVAPEVVQTRKQRKAIAWHARHYNPSPSGESGSRGRRHTPRRESHSHHTSESEEDRVDTWRRV